MGYSFQQLEGFAEQGGFPANVAPTMAAIAMAESSGVNVVQQGQPYSTTGWGLWQITPGNSEPNIGVDSALLDPVTNARAAYAKYQSQGLGAWTTYTDGAYQKFMNGAPAAPGGASSNGGGLNPLSGVTASLNNIGQSFSAIAGLADKLHALTLPQTWVRIMSGILGVGFVGFGIVLLAKEARHG